MNKTNTASLYPAVHAAQVSIEEHLRQNQEKAEALLAENARIEAEMARILSEPPPPQVTTLPSPPASGVARMTAEKEVIYAALAIVRSWQRRHKKNWRAQERELANAVERLTWEP